MEQRRKQTLILLFLLCAYSVHAQESEVDTSLYVGEVLILKSGTSIEESRSSGIVNVISSELLSKLPLQSVDEALTMLPGVNSNRTSGLSQMVTTVSLRGLSGDEQGRTLVLMDGVPINTSDNGTVNWNSINPANVAKIELLKGAASALYGANAIGGVINIVTKKASSPLAIMGSMEYGTLNTWRSNLSLSSRLSDKVSFFLGGNYSKSDGYINIPDSLITQYTYPTYVSEYGVNSKLLYSPTKHWELDLSYSMYRDRRGEGEKILAERGEYRRFDNDRVQFSARRVGNDFWRMSITGYFQQERYFKLDERVNGGVYQRFDVHAKREDLGIIFNGSLQFRDNRLSFGAELRGGAIDGGDYYKTSPDTVRNRGELDIYSLYIRDEQTLFKDKLWMQVALRYDFAQFHDGLFQANGESVGAFSNYNGELALKEWGKISPNVSIRYTPSAKLTAYLTYGRGFRASILDDMCRSGWMWIGPKIANPELGPEYVDNFEFGTTMRLGRFIFDKSLHYGVGHDFLYYVPTGEKLYGKRDIFIRKNISKVEFYGGESAITYDNRNGLYMNLNYSMGISKIVDANGNETLKGKYLTYAPKFMVKFYALWSGRVGEASLKTTYKSKQYVTEDNSDYMDGFVMCDLAVGKWFWNRTVGIRGEVLNLFDRRETNSPNYLSPGRLFNLKIMLNL